MSLSSSTQKLSSVIFDEPDASLYSKRFTDKDSVTSAARFPNLLGFFVEDPRKKLAGMDRQLGQVVSQGLLNRPSNITWEVRSPSEFPNGFVDVSTAVGEERCWVAVTIRSGATTNLNAAVTTVNATYDGSEAVTVFGDEARSENAYRTIVRSEARDLMEAISDQFALSFVQELAASSPNNLTTLLLNAPQIVTKPLSHKFINLRPFNVSVASAAVFVGLIDLTILSLFVVMSGNTAREQSGLNRLLSCGSLFRLRLATTFVIYLLLSLFYSLLNVIFRMPYAAKFGPSGFLILWMVNYVGMLALGLALEVMLTLMTANFVSLFLLLWIAANISVALWPPDLLPGIFRYAYASPFYNMSRAMRTIFFGTKNNIGQNFSVLIGWIVLSCVTLPLSQWLRRRIQVKAAKTDESNNHVHEKDVL
ncbi:hypothetical protein ONZ45_g399 [Pleurotus djamor]|nr:hypothetical protein ONZ45_g399 [Pleurotus djamor]